MATNDVLSEGEIDALMEKVSDSLEVQASGEYQAFDFSARELGLLARMTLLVRINEQHAEDLAAALAGAFDLEVKVTAAPARLLSTQELLMSMGEVAGVTRLAISPFDNGCYVIADAELLTFLVNAFFGGASNPAPMLKQRSGLTPSELRICELVNATVVDTMRGAWSEHLVLEAGDTDTEMTTDALQSEPGDQQMMRTTFTITVDEFVSTIDLVVSFDDIARHKERLMPVQKQATERANHAEWEPYFRREMLAVPVSLSAVLTSQEMPLVELLGLQVGAVLPLKMPDHVTLQVEDTTYAAGEYGAHDGKKAIKIHHITAQPGKLG